MGSFGERLQREREMRGITLEEISESTKITSRCLQALEEEEFDKLPGGIFNKGFVRAYAHYLGIDEDQAVADFVVASGGEPDQPLPDPPEPRAVTLGQQRAEGNPNWRAIALVVVLLVTAVAVLWKLGPSAVRLVAAAWTARSNPEPAAASPATASVSPQSTPEVAATPPPPAATKKSVAKAKPVEVAASDPATAPPATPVAAAAPSPPLRAPAAAPPPAARSVDFVVQIRATEDAWVQIVADGKLFSEGVMVPPAEKRVRAAKQVVIKTGNGAGVEVSFNGQPLPPLGEENQMATVTLTAAGVQR
jgi:cytoskeleton protein RodZ